MRIAPRHAFSLAFAIALTACGSGTTTSIKPPDFVRLANTPTVMYFSRDTTAYCVVINPAQMNAYGGFSRVRVLPKDEKLPADARQTGPCAFPDGVYRAGRATFVLSGDTICTARQPTTPDRMVPPGTDLSEGRRHVAAC